MSNSALKIAEDAVAEAVKSFPQAVERHPSKEGRTKIVPVGTILVR